jgi:cell division septation protein DedD
MKHLYLFIVISFSSFLYFSCNSTSYDLEEVEEAPDTTHIAKNSEIKQEIEKPKQEIMEEPSNLHKSENIKFTIQLGAFQFETNAIAVINKAKNIFNLDVSYKFIDGLYKVRLGEFDSRADALTLLNNIHNSGYQDSFILKK